MTTGAEHGEIAEVGTPVAVDPDPVDTVRPWRWTTVAIATAIFHNRVIRCFLIRDCIIVVIRQVAQWKWQT